MVSRSHGVDIAFGVTATVSWISHTPFRGYRMKLFMDMIDVAFGRHVTMAGTYIPVPHQPVTPHRFLSLSESLHCFARPPTPVYR